MSDIDQFEQERIREEYSRRKQAQLDRRYDMLLPGNLFIVQSRERQLLRLLAKHGYGDLGNIDVLDLGCGYGGELRRLLQYGADVTRITGVDLIRDRIRIARRNNPASVRLVLGNGEMLPFRSGCFDLALMFTVMSSILDADVRAHVASEAVRVLRPGGAVVWYDFWMNPGNRSTIGITKPELRRVFPRCDLLLERSTLAPPLARRLTSLSWTVAAVLHAVPALRTHYVGLIRPTTQSATTRS